MPLPLVCCLVAVQSLSNVWLFATPWTAATQASLSFTISQSLLKLISLSQWRHPTILSSVASFSFCPQSFPASGSFPLSWLSASGGQEWKLQLHKSFRWIFRVDFLYECLVWSPCSSRGSEESSSTPQFKSINSSALSFLYGPSLTSIHDYWKNRSFD